MLTASFLREVESQLGNKLRKKTHIRRVMAISGGSINQSARLNTTSGDYFMKANDAFQYPKMFEKEVTGLESLRALNLFTIPEVILTGEEEGQSFLILKFIESKTKSDDFWEKFGSSLAKMHRHSYDRFGFSEDNYIGSLNQSNQAHKNWVDFFIEERLRRQLNLAIKNHKMESNDLQRFERLFLSLYRLIPEEEPAFLHGDLWSGNFMSGNDGEPCLIDPAVYFGHREVDLAMTKLFGGFDDRFYKAYEEEYPLQPEFSERTEIHNLYPLMVHVNLFGGQYVSQVRNILKKFS